MSYRINIDSLKELMTNNQSQSTTAYSILPFPTREPERFDFNVSNKGIVGTYLRVLSNLYLEPEFELEKEFGQFLSEKLRVSSEEISKEEIILELTSVFTRKELDYTLYKLENLKSEGKRQKGEEKIALFLSQIYKLDQETIDKLDNSNEFEILADFINEVGTDGTFSKTQYYNMLPEMNKKFNEDIKFCLQNKRFLIDNLDSILIFYFAMYVLHAVEILRRDCDFGELTPKYFAYDTESISKHREPYKNGYQAIKMGSYNVLTNLYLLVYLNSGQDTIYSVERICNSMYNYENLRDLNMFLKEYASVKLPNYVFEKEFTNMNDAISELRNLIIKFNEAKEKEGPKSRYAKSIEHLFTSQFLKKRGSLGYTFNITQEYLIMLVTLCVKEDKMLVEELFEEFKQRGLFMDNKTQDFIIEELDKLNIIEKKSDGGEVQYVKRLL